MKPLKIFAIVATCTALFACDKGNDANKTDPNAAKEGGVTTSSAAVTPVTIAETDLVTPADKEAEADKTVTKANYKAQLASLEAEMAKE